MIETDSTASDFEARVVVRRPLPASRKVKAGCDYHFKKNRSILDSIVYRRRKLFVCHLVE
jgi:hypothetical protein